ncbi:MAG: D-glycerate dehydrogenase [Bacteroidetes bacterium]|nr:MAG: D-glycerate dehydrogenase [Bacteroidota bacterium]
MPKSVFITKLLPEIGIEMLRKEGLNVTVSPNDLPIPQPKLIEIMKVHDALITVSSDKIDKHFLELNTHIDIISQFAAGYDNIDTVEAGRLGVPIGNTPDAMTEATADTAFGLLLNVSRKMFFMHKTIEKGEWKYFKPKAHLGIELHNKTLGIFGMGRIGTAMARRCKGAYGMKIIYFNRNNNIEAEKELGAQKVSFHELLSQSDIISVHSVLSSDTLGIFNRDAFKQMKKSSIFINTARGGIHNETDLIESLHNGEIWGAGLDVTNPEPMNPGNVLLSMENVAVLPHIGSATVEARDAMSRMAAENIIEFYRGNKIPHLLNPESLKNRKSR